MIRPSAPRWARGMLAVVARLVPQHLRADWREEWEAELEVLARTGRGAPYPGVGRFVVGAVPHAVWLNTREWTMDSLWQDTRYALRGLGRTPGFTLVASLTLALGIGANGLIFSFVHGLLLRPPAGIDRPNRLVQLGRSYDTAPRWDNWSWPAIREIAAASPVFSGVAGYQTQPLALGQGIETEEVIGQTVTGGYFGVLGAKPLFGRLIEPNDDLSADAASVAVLGHRLWVRRFGADPAIVGRSILVGSRPYQVIGVAAPGFAGPEAIGLSPQLWVPAVHRAGPLGRRPFDDWGLSWLDGVARLRDGITPAQATSAMEAVTLRLRAAHAQVEDVRVLVAPGVGLDPVGRRQAEQLSFLLAGIVGLVLLLTCTNVANLFLVRGASRRAEVGIRMALGARRSRLVRQFLTESLLVAALATIIAIPLVAAGGRALPLLFPMSLTVSVAPDRTVYLVLAGVGLLTGVLFGTAPAWAAGSRNLTDTLRGGGAQSKPRLREGLVVTQLAVSLGLITGAALLGRSLLNGQRADAGFEPDGLVVAFVNLGTTGRYDEATGRDLVARLVAEVGAMPGVTEATVANQTPIAGGHSRATVRPADRPAEMEFEAERVVVGPRYFETMEIPIVRGRPLGGLGDEPERVVIINQALADLFWPGQDPIGKSLAGEPSWRVVGVAGNVNLRSLRTEPAPAVFYPMSQEWSSRLAIHVRAPGKSGALPGELAQAVARVDPGLPIGAVVDLRGAVIDSLGETRAVGYLVAVFAGLALVLAAIGLYGLVAYGLARRIREMGIRLALGARPEALVRMVLARGLVTAMAGVAVGTGLALLVGKALRGLLFEVSPVDPGVLVGAGGLLLAAAALASWIPARRVTQVDAAASLRNH